MRQETCGTIIEYDEDVTATEATKSEGGALGMRLVTFDELHPKSPITLFTGHFFPGYGPIKSHVYPGLGFSK